MKTRFAVVLGLVLLCVILFRSSAPIVLGGGTITGGTIDASLVTGAGDCIWSNHNAFVTGIVPGIGASMTTNSGVITIGTTSTNYTAYSAGTVYSLTATSALLDFGTTDPSITITTPGTYLIFAFASLKYNGATFIATQTASVKLRRTNNTAADVANAEVLVPETKREVHAKSHRTEYLEHPRRREMGHGMDLSLRRKDGTEIPVEIQLGPVIWPEGRFVVTALRSKGAKQNT